MDVLEVIEFDKTQHSFDIEDCVICMEKYEHGLQMIMIPGCRHVIHVECCEQWFLSKNQEREQRCPFCNLSLDITVLRRTKQENHKNDPAFQSPPLTNTTLKRDALLGRNTQVTPLSNESSKITRTINLDESSQEKLINLKSRGSSYQTGTGPRDAEAALDPFVDDKINIVA